MKHLIRLMRVKHYLKNLLVFAALFFSGRLTETGLLWQNVWGFLAFCALSSFIYILNDLRDAPKDRLHPTKCLRPIAHGDVSPKAAKGLAAVLLGLTIACHGFSGFGLIGGACLLLYLVLNIGYSYGLKNVPVLDITLLTCGFLLRTLYGSTIVGIPISEWLYLTVTSLSFYLAMGKRRNELVRLGGSDTRGVLKHYTKAFLDKNMYMLLGLTNVFYALWCMQNQHHAFIYTVPVVLLICFQYSLDVEGESDGDPVEVLLRDRVLQVMCLLYGLAMLLILYVG